MKKRKKPEIGKKLMSSVLAMTMAMELAPVAALTANAAVSEHLVASLAELYDGDTERARQELEALYEAGIIDETGSMVEMDIREDGEAVTLEDISAKILSGTETGDLTVNGHAATTDQILKINETKNALEIAKMLAQDVKITDEHVENLESLIQGIADGTVDIDAAIESGSLSMNNQQNTRKLAAAPLRAPLATASTDDFPSTKVTTGTVDADAEGKFTAPYISGAEYEDSHSFTLPDPENKTYFTDSATEGIVSDGVITLSCADTATAGSTLTVTASLDKPQKTPVSFDWSAAGGSIGASGSGTVTWEAGETGEKTFTVNVAEKGSEVWVGDRTFVIGVANVKSATLQNGAFAWSKVVKVNANDADSVNMWTELDVLKPTDANALNQNFNTNPDNVDGLYYYGQTYRGRVIYELCEKVDNIVKGSDLRMTVNFSKDFPTLVRKQIENMHLYLYLSKTQFLGEETRPSYSSEPLFTEYYSYSNSQRRKHPITSDNKIVWEMKSSEIKWNDAFLENGATYVGVQTDYELNVTSIGYNNLPTYVRNIPSITSLVVEGKTYLHVTDVSVPAGTYYSGQVIPITVTLSRDAELNSNATLRVNGVNCPLLDSANSISNKATFGYTVKADDAVELNVESIANLNMLDSGIAFPQESFSPTMGDVTIISETKRNSLDFDNIKYGISDEDAGEQVVTVLVPFKPGVTDAQKAWVANENEELKGTEIRLPVPGYPNATVTNYLRGAYFSYDEGKTRFPVYVVNSGGKGDVALACRFAPPMNTTPYLRLDTLNLYMDMTVGIDSASTYLDTWSNAKTDTKGYAYFDGTGKTAAPVVVGASYQNYVKGGVMFDQTQYTSRGTADYASKTENGWLNLDDGNHVYLQDAANPQNRYDVELVANDDLYKCIRDGARAEDNHDFVLSYQISGRKNFTFTDPKYFSWSSSDTSIAEIETDENGKAHISITGTPGDVTFTLHVANGSATKAYDLTTVKLTVLEGKTPFLNISKYSQVRPTLTYNNTDILFASNVTARNAQLDKTTTFTAKLYKAKATGDGYEKEGAVVWTQDFESTLDETVTHITVPGDQLTQPGAYAVEVTTTYYGGVIEGQETPAQELSATAYITAKHAPAIVRLNKLDSYYVTAGNIPKIGYTVTPETAQVEYTIQKSDGEISDRLKASNGVIPFSANKPESLKEAYTITVYARNSEEDEWSVDSMLLTVYNPQILHQIVSEVTAGQIGGTTGGTGDHVDGTTVDMDNHDKIANYGVEGDGYQLTFEDFTALRTDMSLQKIVSVNYGEAAYGLLSDKMAWESSDPQTVSVDYSQGGIYSDVRNYSYTSYTPATDFLLVGKNETGEGEKVTITATHANTGISSSFDVTTTTLEDQLYVFRFLPGVKTDVIYTNGKGVKRTLSTNDKGELAVYEPDGISGAVMARSEYEGKTYVGTLFPDDLMTGERDVASLQLYPCNNLRLREISDATLTFLDPEGNPYNGDVIIRGGAYKNGIYCPGALLSVDNNQTKHNGREDIVAHVENGKLNITLDPTQFKHDPNSTEEFGGAQPGDNITYVFEYRFARSYQPGFVILNAFTNIEGASSPTDSVVNMRNNTSGDTTPQIIHQNLRQYLDGKTATPYTRDVIDFTNNIGVSTRFTKVTMTTDVALPGEVVSHDDNGYTTYSSEIVPHFMLTTPYNQAFTGQVDNVNTDADQIIDLADLDESTLFVFPFSEVPVARSVYTMTDENLNADGLTDLGDNPTTTSAMKAVFMQDGKTVKTETMPFGVSNLSHQRDLSKSDGGAEELGVEVNAELSSQLDLGAIFNDIDAGDMLQKGFVFLSALTGSAGDTPMSMMILPTEDPGTFRIVVSVGYNKREMKTDTNPSIDFDPDHLYDDMESFQKELDELGKDDKKDKKDGEDDADMGEVKVHFNFYGTVILEAKVGVLGDKWGIDFCGGSVGANFEIKYEYGQNFMCGPVPVTISIEAGAHADVEVSFANKAEARALLIDAAVGVSVEAFAGLGFDMSLVALKIGIFGKIAADDNFLYLTTNNQTGNKLDIAGEIGIKLVAKIALIEYENTFASVGFNWSKTWGKYDEIKETWAEEGYAELSGSTVKGKPYTMKLMSNGIAMIEIDNGNEIENRDYLTAAPRMSLMKAPPRMMSASPDGMIELQSNAYPFSNPVLSDDGSILLYISDNDNPDAPEKVVCYAVKSGNSYTDMGRVDTAENNILADTDVVVSGTGSNAFAAWVKQMDSPEKEMHDETTYDDLGMMLNASEIYGGSYVNGEWTVERLTDNTVADMAPAIASSGNRSIVAWRSLSATEMPEEGSEQDLSAMFNAQNTINYRIFDGMQWQEAQIAYNGSAGTVNAIDSAMLPDGTSLLVYTVRTSNDITSSETFYTVIDPNGNVLTTGRLTNDDYTDTNAQVTAVGNQFIVGWYSEHEAGEKGNMDETVVSHDIGLARINANGSVDVQFPESIGGTSASSIGSNFRFSAPAGNTDLSELAIIWVQQKDDDNSKQQLNAVRFYETGGVIGVTAPTTIAETASSYTIDRFDTYTDTDGTVKAVLVGSDYSTVSGVNKYDTIDLTDLPIQAVNDAGESADFVTILQQEPTASMKLASGAFAESAIEVTADTDLRDLMPGLELPVQFTVRNTGTDTVNSVNVKLGTLNETVNGLSLLPGQSAVLTVNYPVPDIVSDVDYTLTADGSGIANGTLVLNRPDVGISGMKIVREGDKTRDVRITLNNATEIPLAGSGKTVKLAFYKDMDHTEQIGSEITVDPSVYQDIDNGICTVVQTLNVTDLIGGAQEVPEDGVRIYARAWVEDTEELYTLNNDANATIYGLLSKYDSQIMMDSALIEGEDGSYTIAADISNNSLQSVKVGTIMADVLDSRNRVLATADITNGNLTLTGEQTKSYSVAVPTISGEPVQVVLRSTEKSVFLDAQTNRGSIDTTVISLTADNKPAGILPEATRSDYTFEGWFTEPTGGELVTNDTVLEGGSTIYAHFVYTKREQSFTVTMNDYEYDGTAHTPTINGTTYGKVTTTYFNADTGEQLAEAPSEAGRYEVRVYADGNYYYNSAELTAEYWITTPGLYHVTAKNGTVNGEPSGEFAPGTDITVKANVPESGKQFRYWKSNGKIVSYDQEFTFTTTSENVEIEAVYLEAMTPEEAAETAMADGVAVDLADAVLKDNAKARFVLTPTLAEGWTVESYGIIYDKTGAVTNADTAKSGLVLNGDYVTKTCSAKDGTAYALNVTPENNNTVWAVGYITVSKDGMTATVYTEPKSGNVAEMQIETNAKVDLADAVLKDSEKARFVLTPEVPDGYTINAYGIVYDKTGAVTNAESAKTGLVLDGDYVTKTCSAKDGTAYALNVTPTNGKTIWAVGYLTVSKDGVTKTIYTEPKSGNVTELKAAAEAEIDANVNVNLADAVLKSGTKARFLLTPEIADGWTVDAYGIVYDKTGAITSATSARYGLVLDNGYATKTCSAKDGTAYALNVTPENDNTIWAVGYITVTKNGLTKTIYTEPKSAKVSELK